MRGKLLISLVAVGLIVLAFGPSVFPASAEQRRIVVTLLGGQQVTVTVDVPPGTPLDQIKLPDFPLPVIGISDGGSAEGGSTEAPAPSSGPSGSSGDAPTEEPQGGRQEKQKTTNRSEGRGDRGGGSDVTTEEESVVSGDVQAVTEEAPARRRKTQFRNPDGTPTPQNPGFSLALPGPAPIGVPNFFIDKFRIPPFLLPIYQAAGMQYGIRWEVLAAINEIETDYGRNLNVSSAGALGWMQFMPATWKQYGTDANKDGRRDPYNPVDAIFAAARYLKAAGAETNLRKAVFAYNHADWYVDSVLMRAQLIGGLPADLVGSLTGLTQGHFPVHGRARYADDLAEKDTRKRVRRGQNAAVVVKSNPSRRGINIYAKSGSPVIAVNDGVVKKIGENERLGRYIVFQDVYGNRYTYGHLKKVSTEYPVPKERRVTKAQIADELKLPRDPKPKLPASAGTQRRESKPRAEKRVAVAAPQDHVGKVSKERLFANPDRPNAREAGGDEQMADGARPIEAGTTFKSYFTRVFGLERDDVVLRRLRPGARVIAGTILGRIGRTSEDVAPHLLFELRPAGRGAPRIDPKPVLDGWKLLESTAIYRAAGKNPFFGPDARTPSIGQILLMSKEALERRVLSDPRVNLYECGKRDIRSGQIDRRVLATLEFLASSGLRPTVTSLKCGHGVYTASGNVSHHSSGNAVDIAEINGIPIMGHQGKGSITDMAVRRLLTLQGTMKPAQIITLMEYEGTDNTVAMGDHADHIHIGWRPMLGTNTKLGKHMNSVLKPKQWVKLIDRLSEIDNPTVPIKPSKYALKVKRASDAHKGD